MRKLDVEEPHIPAVSTWGLTILLLAVLTAGTLVWVLATSFPSSIYRCQRSASLYPLRGDADGDDDIDLRDASGFQVCFEGTDGFAIHRDCLVHDYDGDGDVDNDDFALLVAGMVGP